MCSFLPSNHYRSDCDKDLLAGNSIGEYAKTRARIDESFFAFERPNDNSVFSLNDDILLFDNHRYRIDGKGIDTSFSLTPLSASQEF